MDITSAAGRELATQLEIEVAPALVRVHDGQVRVRVEGRLPNPEEWRMLLEEKPNA